MLNKIILPVAGLGTRLLSVTKEQPKEMLPIFSKDKFNEITLNPIIQIIFEQLYEEKFRNFCFVVGKSKRIIEDHFTPDLEFLHSLENKNKPNIAKTISDFYSKINNSSMMWVNQAQPLGFGHAVLQAKSYVGKEPFLLHAGDTLILSKQNSHLTKIIDTHFKNKAAVTLLVKEIEDPRQYGIVDGQMNKNIIKVTNLEEKPKKPKTKFAIMPIYVFEPIIFDYIEKTKPGKNNEIQLTDAISNMVKDGLDVYAINLSKSITHLDIGNPESYWNSLKISYNKNKN